MRVMQSDLAILNAAQYEDGDTFKRALKESPPSRGGPGTKKRPRTVFGDEPALGDAEEEKKRSRGRPRLDPTDQTAQDRRRTQIRLAQRAYRNRKESAISTLETEVDGLKEVNEEMSQAYRRLFDYATRAGLLEKAPEFGQQFRTLENLAKRSGEYSFQNQEEPESSDSGTGLLEPQLKISRPPSELLGPLIPQPQRSQHLWGGLIVNQDPNGSDQSQSTHSQGLSDPLTSHGQTTMHPRYEIIAHPTAHNASFTQAVGYDQQTASTHPAWTPSPTTWSSLPHPTTYAFQEMTFGRRLQRTAIQTAAQLITMESPPPDRLTRVFGFARLFETYEQIKERTLACIGLTVNDDLSNWKYPFQTLGGAGTHFPDMHNYAPRLGTNAHMTPSRHASPHTTRPREVAPFSLGPFDMRTNKIREHLIGLGGHLNLPGWDGVYWDPDEVDYYLLQNGVSIPALADHWVVEIEDGVFGGNPEIPLRSQVQPTPGGQSSTSGGGAQSTPTTLRTSSTAASSTNISSPDTTSQESWLPRQPSTGGDALASTFTQSTAGPSMPNMVDNITGLFPNQTLMSLATDINQPTSLGAAGTPYENTTNLAHHPSPRRRTWRIDVGIFLEQLVARATCLGRTPAFKPKDVDRAFWASVVSPDAF